MAKEDDHYINISDRRFALTIAIFFLSTAACFAQGLFSEDYPVDTLIAKNRVKTRSCHCKESKLTHIYEYDTPGRLKLSYNRGDNEKVSFVYYFNGDTLCKLKYLKDSGVVDEYHAIYRFLFDSKGRMLFFEECSRDYSALTQRSACFRSVYLYNEYGAIEEVVFSYGHYNHKPDTSLRLPTVAFKPLNGTKYIYNLAGQLIMSRETNCVNNRCSTDSFSYDSLSRLSFHRGIYYLDGRPGYTALMTERYKYAPRKRLIEQTTVWFSKEDSREVRKFEVHYLPNGLIKKDRSGCISTYSYF